MPFRAIHRIHDNSITCHEKAAVSTEHTVNLELSRTFIHSKKRQYRTIT